MRRLLPPGAITELPAEDLELPPIEVGIVGQDGQRLTIITRSAWTTSKWERFARKWLGEDAVSVVARPVQRPPAPAGLVPAAPAEQSIHTYVASNPLNTGGYL